jgi:predicted O-linked N-acetylglucosamine transferase (SPINDLY family)
MDLHPKVIEAIGCIEKGFINKAEDLLKVFLSKQKNNLPGNEIMGIVKSMLGKHAEAAIFFERVYLANPNNLSNLFNLAKSLAECGRDLDAINYYQETAKTDQQNINVWINLGKSQAKINQLDSALTSFKRAFLLDSGHPGVLLNMGAILSDMGNVNEAIEYFDRVIAISKDHPEALYNKAILLKNLNLYYDSIDCYERALSIKPNINFGLGELFHLKMKICDWDEFTAYLNQCLSKIESKSIPSFPLLALVDDPRLHQIAAKIYLNYAVPVVMENQVPGHQNLKPKIKIGYFSCDFYNHATAYLMADFFESHDRSLFETIAFSYGPPTQDVMRQRLQSSFDHFIEVAHLDDRQIANLSKELGIDIAVDLKGFTQGSRLGIFAQRAAPIQVSYLGYPGTLGAEFMDYIIADHALICEENQPFFTEKIIYLPNSYQVNDRQRVISPKAYSRADFGLPTDQFVFCCFNNNYKILPAMFDEWMQLLQAVDHSVLWLFKDNDSAQENLILEARQRGVAAQRLIFAERMDHAEHLARLRLADLFLDTFPYNAHTTGSDALWVGLPVLTLAGKSFASRVGASLLRALDLPELIANSMDQYRSIALQLANDSAKMSRLRHKLAEAITTKPLFDTPQITSHIEKAFLTIYERYMRQQAPEHIDLSLRS